MLSWIGGSDKSGQIISSTAAFKRVETAVPKPGTFKCCALAALTGSSKQVLHCTSLLVLFLRPVMMSTQQGRDGASQDRRIVALHNTMCTFILPTHSDHASLHAPSNSAVAASIGYRQFCQLNFSPDSSLIIVSCKWMLRSPQHA